MGMYPLWEARRELIPPKKAMRQLHVENGDIIQLTNANLPLGRFLKIQPQSTSFLDIHDPKAVYVRLLFILVGVCSKVT